MNVTLRLSRSSLMLEDIKKNYKNDPYCAKIIQDIDNRLTYFIEKGLLYTAGLSNIVICVPRMPKLIQAILEEAHDAPIGGHRSIESTLEKVRRNYSWFRIERSVRKYIKTCDTCQRNKSISQKTMGLLQSLPIPIGRWTSISVDFITHLPLTSRNFDAITVFVDRFMKRAHFIPSKMTDDTEDFAYLFSKEII